MQMSPLLLCCLRSMPDDCWSVYISCHCHMLPLVDHFILSLYCWIAHHSLHCFAYVEPTCLHCSCFLPILLSFPTASCLMQCKIVCLLPVCSSCLWLLAVQQAATAVITAYNCCATVPQSCCCYPILLLHCHCHCHQLNVACSYFDHYHCSLLCWCWCHCQSHCSFLQRLLPLADCQFC